MIGPPSRDELLNANAALQRVEAELRAAVISLTKELDDAHKVLSRAVALAIAQARTIELQDAALCAALLSPRGQA